MSEGLGGGVAWGKGTLFSQVLLSIHCKKDHEGGVGGGGGGAGWCRRLWRQGGG